MRSYKFRYYQDDAHGWIAVKREIVHYFGIAHNISEYSYQKGKTVYLEEDRDAKLLLDALKAKGYQVNLRVIDNDDKSHIRKYDRFKYEA